MEEVTANRKEKAETREARALRQCGRGLQEGADRATRHHFGQVLGDGWLFRHAQHAHGSHDAAARGLTFRKNFLYTPPTHIRAECVVTFANAPRALFALEHEPCCSSSRRTRTSDSRSRSARTRDAAGASCIPIRRPAVTSPLVSTQEVPFAQFLGAIKRRGKGIFFPEKNLRLERALPTLAPGTCGGGRRSPQQASRWCRAHLHSALWSTRKGAQPAPQNA